MNIVDVKRILIKNYHGCDGELFDDGYVDVAVVFKDSAEIRGLLNGYVFDDVSDTVWLWAIFNKRGTKSPYYLTDQDTGGRISGRTNLGKALLQLFDDDIRQARNKILKDLEEKNK